MSNEKAIFGGFIPPEFYGTLEELREIQAEFATKMVLEEYLKNRELEKLEKRSINSDKMNIFMMFVSLLVKVSKKHNGTVKIVEESPAGNAIAEMDSFVLNPDELKLFKTLLSSGASINFEPLTSGKVCVSVVVPGTFE